MKQVLIKMGKPMVEEVPAPGLEKESVLVRLERSCISVGTELGGIKASRKPLWKKAISHPEKLILLRKMIASEGMIRTRHILKQKKENLVPLGYSAAGVVTAVGEGITDIRPGMRVACAGAQSAFHAEFVRVPRNLLVPVPDGVDFDAASTVALGAIALQGARRAGSALGEIVVVVGLGFIGQLAAQILRAGGCRVIGLDMDRARLAMAADLGLEHTAHGDDGDAIERVYRISGGHGADAVLVTAATPSHELIGMAFRMCRKKAKVVLVGDVGLNINRQDIYQKELDFLVSTSYGPGRYDEKYEEHGIDYPMGYVRWTENRNMAEYIRLLAAGGVSVGPLAAKVFGISEAADAYVYLEQSHPKPLLVLLSYPDSAPGTVPARTVRTAIPRSKGGKIGISLVGAGSFAKSMHLPNLGRLSGQYSLRGIMSRTGHNAASIAGQFGAQYSTTEFREILADAETDAVLISTRHDLHADMALEALKAGKHVLVEKPLALGWEELGALKAFVERAPDGRPSPILMTGFNRRFSPYMADLKAALANRTNPMIINYRMNAGHIAADNWVHSGEGGGRNLGEACHIYDLFGFLTGSRVEKVQAMAISPRTEYYGRNDNFIATIRFADGSVASLTYTALGSKEHPKEEMEVFVDGTVVDFRDYRSMKYLGMRRKSLETGMAEKGQLEELKRFAEAIAAGSAPPIPFWQQEQATEIALLVEESLRSA